MLLSNFTTHQKRAQHAAHFQPRPSKPGRKGALLTAGPPQSLMINKSYFGVGFWPQVDGKKLAKIASSYVASYTYSAFFPIGVLP